MSPAKITVRVNGLETTSVTAEDGTIAIVRTSAGNVLARLDRQGNTWFTRAPVIERFGSLFPHDNIQDMISVKDGLRYRPTSLFDLLIPRERKLRKSRIVRFRREYTTDEGGVEIIVEGSET